MKQRTFTKDFKSSAVEKTYQENNVKNVAEALGIRPGLLYTWMNIQEGIILKSIYCSKYVKT